MDLPRFAISQQELSLSRNPEFKLKQLFRRHLQKAAGVSLFCRENCLILSVFILLQTCKNESITQDKEIGFYEKIISSNMFICYAFFYGLQ